MRKDCALWSITALLNVYIYNANNHVCSSGCLTTGHRGTAEGIDRWFEAVHECFEFITDSYNG